MIRAIGSISRGIKTVISFSKLFFSVMRAAPKNLAGIIHFTKRAPDLLEKGIFEVFIAR